jgi:hypothetical protein
LSCTRSSNTSRSRCVNRNLLWCSFPFNGVTPPCPGFVWYNKVKGYSQTILCRGPVNGAAAALNWAGTDADHGQPGHSRLHKKTAASCRLKGTPV